MGQRNPPSILCFLAKGIALEKAVRVQQGRRWTEGTGLGLYIVRKFAEMHSGKAWAESPGRGQGSTFHIELPLEQK